MTIYVDFNFCEHQYNKKHSLHKKRYDFEQYDYDEHSIDDAHMSLFVHYMQKFRIGIIANACS